MVRYMGQWIEKKEQIFVFEDLKLFLNTENDYSFIAEEIS